MLLNNARPQPHTPTVSTKSAATPDPEHTGDRWLYNLLVDKSREYREMLDEACKAGKPLGPCKASVEFFEKTNGPHGFAVGTSGVPYLVK